MKRASCVCLVALVGACSWDWDSRDSRRQDGATDALDAAPVLDAPPATDAPDGGTLWVPTPMTSWQIQLEGTSIDTTMDVELYELDLDVDASVVARVHGAGHRVVCNFSGGTFESFRHDGAAFPSATRGNGVAGSAGEVWLDVNSTAVRDAMAARIVRAATVQHCDAVDPTNVDGFNESTGFTISHDQQVEYDTFLAQTAHDNGISIALSEAGGLVAMLAGTFDWGRTDSCHQNGDCASYMPMIALGKAVLDAEYVPASMASSACMATALGLDVIVKPDGDGATRIACP